MTVYENGLVIDQIVSDCSRESINISFPIENGVRTFSIIIRGYKAKETVTLIDANGNS